MTRWIRFAPLMVSILLTSCEARTRARAEAGVAILDVDTDRRMGAIDRNIYGHFLEHINHSVEDGLYAEQVQGQGFEGKDFETYWKPINNGDVILVDTPFKKGVKSIRLSPGSNAAGISQQRFYVQKDTVYNGSLWVKPERGI